MTMNDKKAQVPFSFLGEGGGGQLLLSEMISTESNPKLLPSYVSGHCHSAEDEITSNGTMYIEVGP